MTLTVWHFLIVCPLVFLAGFVDAIAGGGGLIALPAYLITGLPVHYAIGTNKLSSGMGTAIATVKYAKSGYTPLKYALPCAVFAIGGSTLGATLGNLVSDLYFKIIMLVVLPVTEWYILRGRAFKEDLTPLSAKKTTLIAIAIAFSIGIYDGFYGPGAGTFLLLLLTGAAHLELKEANGVTKVINLSTNVAALAVYIFNQRVLWVLGLTAGVFNILGNYLGARRFISKGTKSVKPIMITVLVIAFVRVLYDLLVTMGVIPKII